MSYFAKPNLIIHDEWFYDDLEKTKFYLKNIIETANFLFSDDFARSRAPDRVGTSIFARTLYKFFPLSGGLRYLSRVEMDEHKELLTLSDRLKVLMPQIVDKNSIMPRRNMFGEVINRKNSWLWYKSFK